jgi:hypothetical protein
MDAMRSSNVEYVKTAASHSRNNAAHWFRYLRKIVNAEGSILSDRDLFILLNSPRLTMFQRVTLKAAVSPGTPTNQHVIDLNKPSHLPILAEVLRRNGYATIR